MTFASLYAVGVTVIVSPGCFARKREWQMACAFALLLIVALVSLGPVLSAS